MMNKRRLAQLRLIVFSVAGYIILGYFTSRERPTGLIAIYALLFASYSSAMLAGLWEGSFKTAVVAVLLFRLSLILMTPNLTDDYFRYIWDGLFVANGFNPYLLTPTAFIASHPITELTSALYSLLNSSEYYSAYPPVCQFIFASSVRVCGADILANIIFMRGAILLADVGTIFLLYKLCRRFNVNTSAIFIYALNPLVIIELTGNLHFEAVMVFFLLLSIYLLTENKNAYSAVSFSVAIGTKLLPLMFLPFLLKQLGWTKSLRYFAIVAATLFLLFLPFLSVQGVSNYLTSLKLYFGTFEFNASIYYLMKWMASQFSGNNFAGLGMIMAVIPLLTIITLAIKEKTADWKSLISTMLVSLTVYFLTATNVHAWYLTTLVALSVFPEYKYPVAWSFAVILAYSAYRYAPRLENYWLVTVEYLIVGAFIARDVFTRRNAKKVKISLREVRP